MKTELTQLKNIIKEKGLTLSVILTDTPYNEKAFEFYDGEQYFQDILYFFNYKDAKNFIEKYDTTLKKISLLKEKIKKLESELIK